MTEMCRMRSSSLAESLAGSSVGSGRFRPPSWWWMWKSSVPFSSHCCLQRTKGMSSELPEISIKDKQKMNQANYNSALLHECANDPKLFHMFMNIIHLFFMTKCCNCTIILQAEPFCVHVETKNSTWKCTAK